MTDLPKPGDFVGGRYQIESLLGEGGMGAVFAAVNGATGRPVAIKWMLPAMAKSSEAVARFLAEARTTARIEHPNVIQILDVGQDGAAPFLVMERLRGESLGERLVRDKRLSVDDAIDIVLAACRGVAEAHSEGVIHRDLKPDNIFLCESKDGTPRPPKVLDFGISKLYDDGTAQQQLTQTGAIMGTPLYMSPEQLDGRQTPDAGFDVYAMGVVLYEALSGRVPYNAATFFVLIQEIVAGNRVPLAEVAPWVPQALTAVVDRAMSSKRESRYATMHELIAALMEVRASLPRGGAPQPAAAARVAAPTGPIVGSTGPTFGAPTGPLHVETASAPGAGPLAATQAQAPASKAVMWGIGAAVAAVMLIGVGVGTMVMLSDDADGPIVAGQPIGTPLPNQPLPNQPQPNLQVPTQPGNAALNLQAVGECGPLSRDRFLVIAQPTTITISATAQPFMSLTFRLPGTGEFQLSTVPLTEDQPLLSFTTQGTTWMNMASSGMVPPGTPDPISGTLSVSQFEPSSGRMQIGFRNVSLQESGGDRVCVINGSVTTTGANI